MSAWSGGARTYTSLPARKSRTLYWRMLGWDGVAWGPLSPIRSFTVQDGETFEIFGTIFDSESKPFPDVDIYQDFDFRAVRATTVEPMLSVI